MGDRRDKRVIKKLWPTHIYDYNYKVAEGYYKPQKEYMHTSNIERDRYSPPKHRTYAERFAKQPWYGTARGLPPHHANNAEVSENLLRAAQRPTRSSSYNRELFRGLEEDDFPQHTRSNRSRQRLEESLEDFGSRPQLSRNLSLDDHSGVSHRYRDVTDKIRSLDADLLSLAPRRSSITRENYTLPSGSTVHKTARTEVSHYDSSSRPPLSPRVRKMSLHDEFFTLGPKPRQRISSVGEQSGYSYSLKQSSDSDNETPLNYRNKAEKLREARRMKESREITNNVYGMVDKMRAGKRIQSRDI